MLKRVYDAEEVDRYVGELHQQLAALSLPDDRAPRGDGPEPATPCSCRVAEDAPEDSLTDVLTAEALEEVRQLQSAMLEHVEARCAAMLAEAAAARVALIDDGQTQHDARIAEAEARAAAIVDDATARRRKLLQDLERERRAAAMALDQERQAIEAELAELRSERRQERRVTTVVSLRPAGGGTVDRAEPDAVSLAPRRSHRPVALDPSTRAQLDRRGLRRLFDRD